MDGIILATGSNSGLLMVLWIVVLFGLMYLLLIRPQRKQLAERNDMIANLQPDTKIMTVGGLTGVVRAVTEEYVYLELAEGLVVELSKQGIGQVFPDEADDDDTLDAQDDDDLAYEEETVELEDQDQ